MSSTVRQDVRDALYALLLSYQVTDSSLRRVEPRHPRSYSETPLAFPDYIDEVQVHANGIRQRTLTPTIMLVTTYAEQEEDVIDPLVDGLADHFTDNPMPTDFPYGVLQLLRIDDGVHAEELIPTQVGVPFRGTRFIFSAVALEGRQ